MLGKSHAILTGLGATAVVVAMEMQGAGSGIVSEAGPDGLLCVTWAVVGSLLPDLDQQESTACGALGWPTRVSGALVQRWLSHRGFLHSVWAAWLVGCLAWWWLGPAGGWLAAGYLAHLGQDMLTPEGVRLFQPFHRRVWRVPHLRLPSWRRLVPFPFKHVH